VVEFTFSCSRRLRASIKGAVSWRVSCLAIFLLSAVPCAFAQEIPAGFKLDRYARVWERNPFLPVTPAAPQAQRPAFDKLFLTSWLIDGSNQVIFVQDSETNEMRRVTRERGQNNLRLVEFVPNPDPHFVAAIISDGREQGEVKFRCDLKPATGETPSGTAEVRNSSAIAQVPARAARAPEKSPHLVPNVSYAQTTSLPGRASVQKFIPQPLYPGLPRVHVEGVGPSSRRE
jgi:hypothetical protein